MQQKLTAQQHKINLFLESQKISMKADFIAWKDSRNAKEKYPSLNYSVSIFKNDRLILTTDYMMGCAHAPSYSQSRKDYDYSKLLEWECNNWRKGKYTMSLSQIMGVKDSNILPHLVDVMYHLSLDSEVLNYETFDSWAGDFGYNADSITHQNLYNQCLSIALKLNNGLGSDTLKELREMYQDY